MIETNSVSEASQQIFFNKKTDISQKVIWEADELDLFKSELASLRKELAFQQDTIDLLRQTHNDWLLKKIKRWIDRALLKRKNEKLLQNGVIVDIVPLNEMEVVAANNEQVTWKLLGEDPHASVDSPVGFSSRKSFYKIRLVNSSEVFRSAKVYFNFGQGYDEINSQHLFFNACGEQHIDAIVYADKPLVSLRFDPAEAEGEVLLSGVLLQKVNSIAFAAAMFRYMSANKMSFARKLKLMTKYALKGDVNALVSGIRSFSNNLMGVDQYAHWIQNKEKEHFKSKKEYESLFSSYAFLPKISILMPVYNVEAGLLREAIDSVLAQVYENWELCIVDDCSPKGHIRPILTEYINRDPRIKVLFSEENGHISKASNRAMDMVTGEWVALLDHDDLLRPESLAEVVIALNENADAEMIYSDEDKINEQDERFSPFFKPDFSRELFRSQNYFNHLTVHRSENIRKVGGWRLGYEGSQDYDLNLRIGEIINFKNIIHIPKVLYHWRAVAGSTALAQGEKNYAFAAGLRALEDHVARTGGEFEVVAVDELPYYRLKPKISGNPLSVAIIIPTRDGLDILSKCITSILEKTTYKNYRIIIVDNGSVKSETHNYFEKIVQNKKVEVLDYPFEFNYSAINNYAVERCSEDIICLMNNDIEIISEGWLDEMVGWASRKEIGAVGAKLYYPNDMIQHAGVIIGIGGVAGHSHKYLNRNDPGYFSRAALLQNLSAVTAACLVVRRDVFNAVNGLNAVNLKVAFNDIDFCLKVKAAGYSNVFTPYAEMYHHESVSRGAEDNPEKVARFNSEVQYMKATWDLTHDEFYSPNLTQSTENFAINI